MTVTVANLPYDFTPTASAASTLGFMFKNAYDAWFYDLLTATATQITDVDYPGYHTYSVTTLTSVGTTATATTSVTHGLKVNDSITIAGATQTEYNGTYTVTGVPATNQFTYTFAGSATSPATGTITATGGRTTVRGIVWLDGTFYVMDANATIYGSDLNAATTWSALNFITAEIEPGAGVALQKSQNYVIALKEWSTEFFYDAGNATGSPLSPVENGFNLIGCASGDSVANVDGTVFWLSQTRQKGRGVYMMNGLEHIQISTPDVERILNLSTLATVYSFGVKISGHTFYVLTLVDQNVTLVYDATTKLWATWSSLTAASPVSVSSLTLSGTTVTAVTATAHGMSDGDPVNIAGATPAGYNGIFVTTYISATSFSYETTSGLAAATGTITATPYTETYFKYVTYINALSKDLVQHETDGTLCELTEAAYQDVGIPVNVLIRTGKLDGGTVNLKRFAAAEIIGNKVSANAYIRHSGDDYVTYTTYRKVDLNQTRSVIRRLGADRRRSFDIRHLDNSSLQISELDLEWQ